MKMSIRRAEAAMGSEPHILKM